MKKALMVLGAVILASCTTIKQLKNQDIQNYNASTHLVEKTIYTISILKLTTRIPFFYLIPEQI